MIQTAFKETMGDIERRMEARVRGKDEEGLARDEDRVTGNLVYAAFTHRVTRPVDGVPDPHYHIHAFVFNATYDEFEPRWKAGQFGNVKRDAPFYEAAFNARLAKSLAEAGYGIRRTERSFELASVSRDLIEKFSRRTNHIERLAREKYPVLEAKARALVKETGMDFADAFAQIKSELGALSREKKSAEILNPEERLRVWRAEMTAEERAALSKEAVRAKPSEGLLHIDAAKPLAIAHLFERVSVSSAAAGRRDAAQTRHRESDRRRGGDLRSLRSFVRPDPERINDHPSPRRRTATLGAGRGRPGEVRALGRVGTLGSPGSEGACERGANLGGRARSPDARPGDNHPRRRRDR